MKGAQKTRTNEANALETSVCTHSTFCWSKPVKWPTYHCCGEMYNPLLLQSNLLHKGNSSQGHLALLQWAKALLLSLMIRLEIFQRKFTKD